MPPYDFDEKRKRFRDKDGRLVSRREVRPLIQKLTDTVAKDAAKIATRYSNGKINLTQFEIEMRELLKSGHIVAASVGRGGRERMTASDWGKVGAKIKWQNGYLAKFARKIGQGKIAKIATASRARSYASSLYISYSTALQTAHSEFIGSGRDAESEREMLCYLEQNSEEGCVECTADAAAGPMPVSEMGELGSRICGDFCKCEIIFEDEPEYKP
jgi:hypothetical protein